MDPRTISKEELAALLREAEKAHAEYEKMLGGRDDDWPTWYADFVLKKLQNAARLTTRPIEVSEEPKAATGPLNLEQTGTQAATAAVQTGTSPKPPTEPIPKLQPVTPTSVSKTAPLNEAPKAEPATTSMQVCPTCGHRNRFGVLLCENCGTNLSTGQQSGVGTRDLRDPSETEESSAPAPTKLDTSEEKAVRSAGSARFETNMTLRIEVEGGATPIILKPKTHDMILGRRDPTTGATPEVDLTPYAGYRMGVSRKHASLRMQESQLNLWDLGSSNGTFINGTRLSPHRPYPIRDGDEIRLGQMVLRLFFQSGQLNRP